VKYAVYIALPPGESAEPIIGAASKLVLPGHSFSIREHGDPNAGRDGELFIRLGDVSLPEDALAGALRIYDAAREAAGLRRDSRAEASFESTARSA
jgi:hypothetical protein